MLAIAVFTGPAAPILAGVGLALTLIPTIFGIDPKKSYSDRESKMLDAARYTAPTAQSYAYDISGASYDHDLNGNVRIYQTNQTIIHAMDAKSFEDFAGRNENVFGEMSRRQIDNNQAYRNAIQSAVGV